MKTVNYGYPKEHSPVAFAKCASYERGGVEEAVEKAVGALGGIEKFVKKGDKVLLKPNLLRTAPADKAVCTHPEALRAAIRLVKTASPSVVWVGDSPAVHKAESVAKKCGLWDVVAEEGVEFASFKEEVELKNTGCVFKTFNVAREIAEADAIINLPKAKTHTQMVLTLGVKNLFGAVIGTHKSGWHLKNGTDYNKFARMLLDLYIAANPALTIMDAVVGMEGDGPGNGDPVKMGFVAASASALSLDMAVGAALGTKPEAQFILQEAFKEGLPSDMSRLPLLGDSFDSVKLSKPIVLPELFRLKWYFPESIASLFARAVTSKPVVDKSRCTVCGMCVNSCPPKVISKTKNDKEIAIDYNGCIRCFCCQEICPVGAMKAKRGIKLFD